MAAEEPAAAEFHATRLRGDIWGICCALAIFSGLSFYCAVRSEGFIAADACTHFLAAKFAFANPLNFVNVWNRPLVTLLYALPAYFGGRLAVRFVCMLVALGCGWVAFSIGKGQGLKWPVLAMIFTLGQPLLFIHSFGEMTELPFALVLGCAFLAWQEKKFWLAAALVSWTPLARPEGFGFILIAAFGLLVVGQWRQLILLPIPIVIWDIVGWIISRHSHPWYRWLPDSWPYSQESLYGKGYLLTFVALLPAVVSPMVLPATMVGIWRSLRCVFPSIRGPACGAFFNGKSPASQSCMRSLESPTNNPKTQTSAPQAWPLNGNRQDTHLRFCIILTAALPMFVLIVHSLLYRLGKMASFGEARYLLVTAPLWGVVSARGWEYLFGKLCWPHPLRWAAAAVLLPIALNALHPVVPVQLSHDWQSARTLARWYESRPAYSSHARLLAAHPGILYFLGINPQDSALGKASLSNSPPGTTLIWDPLFSATNASADCTLTLEQIHQAGWNEIPAPNLHEEVTDPTGLTTKPKTEADLTWHVFIAPGG